MAHRIPGAVRSGYDCNRCPDPVTVGGKEWVAELSGIGHCNQHILAAMARLMSRLSVKEGGYVIRDAKMKLGSAGRNRRREYCVKHARSFEHDAVDSSRV